MSRIRVLVVGEGARENAASYAFSKSSRNPEVFAISKLINPGIARICEETHGIIIKGDSLNPKSVVEAAEKVSADLVFIGPEEPLFHGVANELQEKGIACVGAVREAAEIEMSKAFMRRLMWKYKIPGRLRFQAFRTAEEAASYIKEYAESIALKPARQAGGKGVKVIADLQAYLSREKESVKSEHARAIYEKHMSEYTDIEDKILIEERVEGPEYTVQTVTDGYSVLSFPLVQDNKNAYEMDIGPETGGMGSISGPGMTLPFLTEDEKESSVDIVRQSVSALEKDTRVRYKGVISGQMMLTPLWGPTIIEFYSRFGDPEGVNVLPALQTDFVELCEAIVGGHLAKLKLAFDESASVVKCVAPQGYPERRDLAKGHPVHVDSEMIRRAGCQVFFGSADKINPETTVSGGSRIAEVLATGENIPQASDRAEKGTNFVACTDGWGVYHRSDIGSRALLERRIEQANLIREVYRYRRQKNLVGVSIDWVPGQGRLTIER